MGKYTLYDNNVVDLEIDNKLRMVVECITRRMNNNIVSILLTGGYGRGEGSVIIKNGDVQLLKDFDIAVVVNKMPDKITSDLILEDIYKTLNSRHPSESLFKYSDFAVDLRYLKINNIDFPDIWFYDLKNSTVLYGKDIRNLISYTSNDIPLSSGLRLIFEKITGLLGHFEYKMFSTISDDAKMRLVYECMKTYIEIATALCILHKTYVSSYRKRAEIVKDLATTGKLTPIINDIPNLLDKIEIATRFKLMPDHNLIKDPLELFFNTRNDLAIILKHYIKYYIGYDIQNWLDIDIISKQLAKVYYKPMLRAWYRNTVSKTFKLNENILNILYQIYTNLIYNKINGNYSNLYIKPLFNGITISPSLKFFPIGLLILLSLNKDGSNDHNLLLKAIKLLRMLVPFTVTNWEDARIAYLKAYKYYLYPTLLK